VFAVSVTVATRLIRCGLSNFSGNNAKMQNAKRTPTDVNKKKNYANYNLRRFFVDAQRTTG